MSLSIAVAASDGLVRSERGFLSNSEWRRQPRSGESASSDQAQSKHRSKKSTSSVLARGCAEIMSKIMDWFERLTGFRETGYEETRARLELTDRRLRSRINGASYGIGELELISLQTLRERAKLRRQTAWPDQGKRSHRRCTAHAPVSRKCWRTIPGSIAVQSARDGVARCDTGTWRDPLSKRSHSRSGLRHRGWRSDHLPELLRSHRGGQGQTATRQLNGLADLGAALSGGTKLPVGDLWTMKNGYALGSKVGLDAITRYLQTLAPDHIDVLRRKLRIGIHRDVEVTEAAGPDRPRVSQAFCSALPVAYSQVPSHSLGTVR